jgi:hypothetical protein
MYSSFDIQHREIERHIRRGFTFKESAPVRDRLGRVLIALGSQLVTEPVPTARDELRRAA